MDRWLPILVTAGVVVVFCVLQFVIVNAEVGKVTVLSGGTFSTISTAEGKIKATNQKTTVAIQGSGGISVSANPATKTLLIDGGGLIPSWANITDKPSVFPPDAHNQNISTINGLEAALSAKHNQSAHESYSAAVAGQLATKASAASLAIVATSGSYPDLTNKPTIPEVCGIGENAIYDGAPALSCAILGNFAFSYNAANSNPLPEMLPYTALLYEVGLNNNEPIAEEDYTIKWEVADNSLLVQGQYSTQHTYNPTILGNYSANRTNWIKATLVKGLKTCIALMPVSVTKFGERGADGATGNPAALGTITATTIAYGSPATAVYSGPSTARNLALGIPQGASGETSVITKALVQGVYTLNALSGGVFALRPYTADSETDTTSLMIIYDSAGYKRKEETAKATYNYHSDGVTKNGFSNYSGVVTIW